MKFRVLATLVAACLYASATATAQSITTAPTTAVPVGNPLGLLALGALLIGGLWWMLQRWPLTSRGAGLVAVAVAAAIGTALVLNAQATLTFSDPSGETLSIPITTQPGEGLDDVGGWEPADFTNNSGVDLLITAIDEPTASECFPDGLDGELAPGSSDPSPHPLCEVNDTLANGATCRVDVETICRAAAEGNLATLASVDPTSGPNTGGTNVTLTGTNLTGAIGVTFGGIAATSVSVVNATTVTAVTPAHANGAADVVILTPLGSATLSEAYTYTGPTLTAVTATSGSASGGLGVTITGTNLTGTTSLTFDGIAATSVNVVNATTVTAVTPAHVAGSVDVAIATPEGDATLANGFTFVTTAVGQPAFGGIIAALYGGLNNLIAAVADNSSGVEWGGDGVTIGVGAQSNTDGASNTAAIVAALGANEGVPYAALVCSDYEVDSQGNTPCEAGNACYNDWFLPAGSNTTASGQLMALFAHGTSIGGISPSTYLSSTEVNTGFAWAQHLTSGSQSVQLKAVSNRVRCVRAFTP